MRLLPSAALAAALASGTVPAQEIVLGVGATDFSADGASDPVMAVAEWHAAPFVARGRFALGLAAAGTLDDAGNAWIGGGLAALVDLGRDVFVEASLVPGYYVAEEKRFDLGSDVEFRSLLGIGYRLSDRSALSLAVSHRSNGGIGDFNPGMNALTLRLRTGF